jgi:hypothetical protein
MAKTPSGELAVVHADHLRDAARANERRLGDLNPGWALRPKPH